MPLSEPEYTQIKIAIREVLNLDLAAYKPDQMRRRLASFIERQGGTRCRSSSNTSAPTPLCRRRCGTCSPSTSRNSSGIAISGTA